MAAEDSHGNVVTTFSGNVTLALANNPWGASWVGRGPSRRLTAWPPSPA